jgi:hypothetical protein
MILSMVVSMAFSAGCGGKKDDAGKKDGDKEMAPAPAVKYASCNMPKTSGCREYSGDNLAIGTDGIKQLCAGAGDFGDVACPTAKMTATCKVPEHKDFYDEGYPIPLPELEKMCKDRKGTWTAAPAQ